MSLWESLLSARTAWEHDGAHGTMPLTKAWLALGGVEGDEAHMAYVDAVLAIPAVHGRDADTVRARWRHALAAAEGR